MCWVTKDGRKVLKGQVKHFLEKLVLSLKDDIDEDSFHIVECRVMDNHVHLIVEIAPYCYQDDIIPYCKDFAEQELIKQFPDILLPKQRHLWSKVNSVRTMAVEEDRVFLR